MADIESSIVREIFWLYGLDFWKKREGAQTFHHCGYGVSVTIRGDYAIVRTSRLRWQGLKLPRKLQLRKFDELAKEDLCSLRCEVPAVTILGDPSRKWFLFQGGAIQVDNGRSMTVFRTDGLEKSYNH